MSVSNEIIKVLDALAEKFGMVIDWTSQNVIPYLEQLCMKYIRYEVVTSVVWLIFGIIFMFLGEWFVKTTKYSYKMCKEHKYSDWDVAMVFSIIGAMIAFITGMSVMGSQIFDVVTCLTFPEKLILEELKTLYSTM